MNFFITHIILNFIALTNVDMARNFKCVQWTGKNISHYPTSLIFLRKLFWGHKFQNILIVPNFMYWFWEIRGENIPRRILFSVLLSCLLPVYNCGHVNRATLQAVKVSKFRKQIFLFSFEPKHERTYFLVSAIRV